MKIWSQIFVKVKTRSFCKFLSTTEHFWLKDQSSKSSKIKSHLAAFIKDLSTSCICQWWKTKREMRSSLRIFCCITMNRIWCSRTNSLSSSSISIWKLVKSSMRFPTTTTLSKLWMTAKTHRSTQVLYSKPSLKTRCILLTQDFRLKTELVNLRNTSPILNLTRLPQVHKVVW